MSNVQKVYPPVFHRGAVVRDRGSKRNMLALSSKGGLTLCVTVESIYPEAVRLVECGSAALDLVLTHEALPAEKEIERISALHPADEWHEEDGPVLWHHLDEWGGLCEAPIVSRGDDELDDAQPWPGYYSHWSHLPRMERFPLRSLMIAPPDVLICDREDLIDA